jgi:hypothetical protein
MLSVKLYFQLIPILFVSRAPTIVFDQNIYFEVSIFSKHEISDSMEKMLLCHKSVLRELESILSKWDFWKIKYPESSITKELLGLFLPIDLGKWNPAVYQYVSDTVLPRDRGLGSMTCEGLPNSVIRYHELKVGILLCAEELNIYP